MREGFQFYLEICMADDGFVGRYEVVEPRRGNRRWPDDVKARIVAESFEPGVRVVDVARRLGVIPPQLAYGRRLGRAGFVVRRCAAPTTPSEHDGIEPAFVPLAIAAEPPEPVNRLSLPKLASDGPRVQVLTLEIGSDVVMRVPNDVPVERVAALVRAVRGAL
jgi:transposase